MIKTTVPGRIGIRREDKDITEKRAPLTPHHVKYLVQNHNIEVFVRPSPNRIFTEQEYVEVGATIADDLSTCNIVFGVKEIPIKSLIEQQAYCFFSHTVKGQFYNMDMLKNILSLHCTLLDYEKVTDGDGKRLILFGDFAGNAGMIDSLWAFGQRLLWEGISTPFRRIKQANQYASLAEAIEAIKDIGRTIRKEGLPAEICPVICGFTGSGHVSNGAQEIFDLLDPCLLEAEHLATIRNAQLDTKTVYKVTFRRSHRFRPKDRRTAFCAEEFAKNPNAYENNFEQFIPYLSILINGIYWQPGQPRLVTENYLHNLYRQDKQPKLRVIGDITNDIRGSIECNHRATNSLRPVYVYHPFDRQTRDGWAGIGPVILAVDKLPSEIPKEASSSFGDALMPYIPELAYGDFTKPFADLQIPPEFTRAVIAHQGELTENYKYIESFLKQSVNE